MRALPIFAVVFASLLAPRPSEAAEINLSSFVSGTKYPNSAGEGRRPVTVSVLALEDSDGFAPRGFSELLPYVLRSPDQHEAGSCLYMSLTGIAEMWLARLFPRVSRQPDGPIDLSERYMMNLARDESLAGNVENWKTDSIYLFNAARSAIRNKDYRFTKGWFATDEDGGYVKAKSSAKDAKFGTQYNWIDERGKAKRAKAVRLPKFRREIIFADPESNQWNTGVMPDDIVERIKTALIKNHAPVQVIYNHFGYWHSTIIAGFDDEADNRDCQFVHKFLEHMKKPDANEPETPLVARSATEVYEKTKRAYDRGGGCHPKGVFYVRDSIYADEKGPVYRYDPSNPKASAPYTKRIVMIEYDWVRYMANHAVQITANWE